MRKKIIAENGIWKALPGTNPGTWLIYNQGTTIGICRDGTFKSLIPLDINGMLNVIHLMLHAQHIDRNEEEVLKTKNEEHGN